MKNRILPAIDVVVKPSLLLLGVLSVISILSCLGIGVLPLIFPIKFVMILVVLFSTTYYILRDALHLLPWSWQRVEVSSLGQLRLTNKRGEQFMPELDASSFIHPYLIILNMKKPPLRHWLSTVTLPALILCAEPQCQQQRQLRVWLRWWKHESDE